MAEIREDKIGTSINTISGEAFYHHTEKEAQNGQWNDCWFTSRGEYVTHHGNIHHVYFTQERMEQEAFDDIAEDEARAEEAMFCRRH